MAVIVLVMITPTTLFANGSAYLGAWAKAYAEYSTQVSNAEKDGHPLSPTERQRLHDTLYADVNKIYGREVAADHREIRKIGLKAYKEIFGGDNASAPMTHKVMRARVLEKTEPVKAVNPEEGGAQDVSFSAPSDPAKK